MHKVTIFTDGSCKPNPGAGGWAAILHHGKRTKIVKGGEKESTNIRMELMAAVGGLEALQGPCRVTQYRDSTHVVNCIQKVWSFKTNRDLVTRLQRSTEKHKIKAIWIQGHTKISGNEECDRIAKEQAERIKNEH